MKNFPVKSNLNDNILRTDSKTEAGTSKNTYLNNNNFKILFKFKKIVCKVGVMTYLF